MTRRNDKRINVSTGSINTQTVRAKGTDTGAAVLCVMFWHTEGERDVGDPALNKAVEFNKNLFAELTAGGGFVEVVVMETFFELNGETMVTFSGRIAGYWFCDAPAAGGLKLRLGLRLCHRMAWKGGWISVNGSRKNDFEGINLACGVGGGDNKEKTGFG